jgi:L,D-transpeptidase YcbB
MARKMDLYAAPLLPSERIFMTFDRFRACLTALILSAALVSAPLAAGATATVGVFTQSVAEAASSDADLAAFYRARGYAPLWTGEDAADRRAALLYVLRQAGAHGLPVARYDAETIAQAFRDARGDREIGALEVATTRALLAYAQDVSSGALDPRALMPAVMKRELPRRDRAELLAGFAAAQDPVDWLRGLAPQSAAYVNLMREKARLERLAGSGGWGPTIAADALEPGQSGGAVVALRDRLVAMGYLRRSASASYGGPMVAAVRAFQADHGITPDGVAGRTTLAEINLGPADRLEQVIVALERERWMNFPEGLGDRHIWVNLVDFHTRVVDDGKVSFETRSVVGERRTDKQTYEFSDEMEYMEVNPDWTVPRSILGRDYLPRMQSNPNAASYLQLIDARGQVVSREAIDFSQYTARNFPFTVRQPPGPGNSLGLVKFMFPNPHAIYLHDTPQKNLFDREVRDYSSGCIRLQRPFDLAYHLLARQMDDPRTYFDRLVNSGRQTRIDLDVHVPVHLVYFTAFVTPEGRPQYRRDIYGRDAVLFDALSAAGVALPGVGG